VPTSFVADALKADPAATNRPDQICSTKKNRVKPFFSSKFFLHQLVDEKLLWLDRNRRAWQWDLGKIQQLAITDNVVELLTHKMERITPAAQQLLKIAACLGNEFDLITLHEVAGHAPHEVARQLWEPLSTRFILPLSESYKNGRKRWISRTAWKMCGTVFFTRPRPAGSLQPDGRAGNG
jgi:predicted ATPase